MHHEAEKAAQQAAEELEAEAEGLEGVKGVKSGWPKNLRVLEFVEKRERFWKVSLAITMRGRGVGAWDDGRWLERVALERRGEDARDARRPHLSSGSGRLHSS